MSNKTACFIVVDTFASQIIGVLDEAEREAIISTGAERVAALAIHSERFARDRAHLRPLLASPSNTAGLALGPRSRRRAS